MLKPRVNDEPRIEKLPVWAQSLISQLVRYGEYWEGVYHKCAAAVTPDTKVVWRDYPDGEFAIPENGHIDFLIDTQSGDWQCRATVQRSRDGKALTIRSEFGHGNMVIIPEASNTFRIEFEDKR